jgi:aspartate-semialdehyde dehydrogenase
LFRITKLNQKIMKVAVVGVTGMVGQVMLEVLNEQQFPIT